MDLDICSELLITDLSLIKLLPDKNICKPFAISTGLLSKFQVTCLAVAGPSYYIAYILQKIIEGIKSIDQETE